MAEVGRFFDDVLYGEADQAFVQTRFRPNGVLPEAGFRLAVSAPGGMFVQVSSGEAFVEGFHYQNTAALNLPIANNSSGSLRYDRIVLRLTRTTNTLAATVITGTPGSGLPALTQIVGGTWDLPLAVVVVPSGTLNVSSDLISDQRIYSLHPNTTGIHGKNLLRDSSFRINQREITSVTTNGQFVCDRWQVGLTTATGWTVLPSVIGPGTSQNEAVNVISFWNSSGGAPGVDTLVNMAQVLTGDDIYHCTYTSVVLSFNAWCQAVGTFGVNIEQVGTGRRFVGTFEIHQASVWEPKHIVVPLNSSGGTWAQGNAHSLSVRFIAACGSNHKAAASNQWVTAGTGAAGIDNSMGSGTSLFIQSPKLEIGTVPTRYQLPDLTLEELECQQFLYVVKDAAFGYVYAPSIVAVQHELPVRMRTNAPVFSVPVAPSIITAPPGVGQMSYLATNNYVGSLTYSSWTGLVNGRHTYTSQIAHSTTTGTAVGTPVTVWMGSTIQAVISAE